MVKRRIQPVVSIVAHLAIRRISLCFMVLGGIILSLMAGDAIRPGVQHSPLMTVRTLNNECVSTGQGKSGGGMAEC